MINVIGLFRQAVRFISIKFVNVTQMSLAENRKISCQVFGHAGERLFGVLFIISQYEVRNLDAVQAADIFQLYVTYCSHNCIQPANREMFKEYNGISIQGFLK